MVFFGICGLLLGYIIYRDNRKEIKGYLKKKLEMPQNRYYPNPGRPIEIKGYHTINGYFGHVGNGNYRLFDSEKSYREFMMS